MNRTSKGRNGVRRTLSTSSAGSNDSQSQSLLPRRNTYRKKQQRNKSPPASPVQRWLYVALISALLFCLLDAIFLVKYVFGSSKKKRQGEARMMPELIRKDEDEMDDGIRPEGDGDDHVPRKVENVFGEPESVPNAVKIEKTDTDNGDTDTNNQEENVDDDTVKVTDDDTDASAQAANTIDDPEKEPILKLLRDADIPITPEIVAKLPKWSQVAALYGDEPVVYGLDQCERFQTQVTDPAEHFLSTAGTFNTGTNLMAELLIHNCHMPARMKKYGPKNRGIRWQVLWGKHTPVGDEEFRVSHKTYKEETLTAENIFPAVTVRDPFKWMQSMCRHQYGAYWRHNATHCPNLIPDEADLETFPMLKPNHPVPVRVKYAEFTKHHDSLADFWNDWYREYVDAPFPRLMVRFEDAIFHPKKVTQLACECAGGQLNKGPFRYEKESAKKGVAHGTQKTTYVDALIKYGTEEGRYKGYNNDDLDYARQHLDPHLMEIFGYKFPPENYVATE